MDNRTAPIEVRMNENAVKTAHMAVKLMQDTVEANGQVVLTRNGGFFADECDKTILTALEKQTPRKPKIIQRLPTGYVHWVCPRCETPYVSPLPCYCNLCGQALALEHDK